MCGVFLHRHRQVPVDSVTQCPTQQVKYHRVASTPELATNFIDYKQMAGMTTVRKSCY